MFNHCEDPQVGLLLIFLVKVTQFISISGSFQFLDLNTLIFNCDFILKLNI